MNWPIQLPANKATRMTKQMTDAMDPAFAPGVSHWEPGGLSVRQLLQVLQQVTANPIVGADLVEYNPRRDPSGRTAMVAAKLMKELMGLLVA